MGVLFDYFRASDPSAAARAAELPDGLRSLADDGQPRFDVLETKGVDPTVTLGKLVAIARGDAWSTGTVTTSTVWPPPETAPADAEAWAELPEESPWMDGPLVEELDDQTRDTLADISDDRRAVIAARWAQIEELAHIDARDDSASSFVAALAGLARRAREAGDRLYCLSCA